MRAWFRSETRAIPAQDRIESGLAELKNDVRDLESASRSLKLEYIELYDKVARQMSRMAKRYALDHPEELQETESTDPGSAGNSVDTISASILRRRAGYEGKR